MKVEGSFTGTEDGVGEGVGVLVGAKVAIGVTVGTQVMVGNGASVGRGVTVGTIVGMSVAVRATVGSSATVTAVVGDMVAAAPKPALSEVAGVAQADKHRKRLNKTAKILNLWQLITSRPYTLFDLFFPL